MTQLTTRHLAPVDDPNSVRQVAAELKHLRIDVSLVRHRDYETGFFQNLPHGPIPRVLPKVDTASRQSPRLSGQDPGRKPAEEDSALLIHQESIGADAK